MTRTLAIVPARAGSKRVPGKNMRDFLGKPLVVWSIEFARGLPRFDRVHVSTDDESIAQAARASGVNVPWLRPPALASDTATTVDVVLHSLATFAEQGEHFEYVAVLQPTTPVRILTRWESAFAKLDSGAAAAIGVRIAPVHPFWSYRFGIGGQLTPFFPGEIGMRSQDLPVACVPNGALYLARASEVREHRSLAPPGVRGILCEEQVESIDIDTAADWEEAELLVRGRAGMGQ